MNRAIDLNLASEIEQAAERITPHVLRTPLFYSNYLSELNGGEVYLKLESEQVTGFKRKGSGRPAQFYRVISEGL